MWFSAGKVTALRVYLPWGLVCRFWSPRCSISVICFVRLGIPPTSLPRKLSGLSFGDLTSAVEADGMELQAERTALLSQRHGVSPHKAPDESITDFAAGKNTLILSLRQRSAGCCLGAFFLQANLQPPMAPDHLCFVIGTDPAGGVSLSDRGRSDPGVLDKDRLAVWPIWSFANDCRLKAIPICRYGSRRVRVLVSIPPSPKAGVAFSKAGQRALSISHSCNTTATSHIAR